MRHRKGTLPVVLIALVASFAACSKGSPMSVGQRSQVARGQVPADSDRFPHGLHSGNDPRIKNYEGRGLRCTDCHSAESVVSGKPARPGANQHAPCDDCHKAEFFKPPGALCRVCHKKVDPFKPHSTAGWEKNPDLQPYPERGGTQTLVASFSHELHMSEAKMEKATGAHVGCNDCHERNQQTRDPQVVQRLLLRKRDTMCRAHIDHQWPS